MTLAVERPAPFIDLLDMVAANALPKLNPVAVARLQRGGGRSWGYRDAEGTCVACAGLYELAGSPGRLEAWFACRPAARAHMLAFVRLAQLTLRAVTEDGPVDIRVDVSTPAGRRIAAAVGFRCGVAGEWEWL